MAIVTGDRYLESLVRYATNHTAPLLDGTLTLKLNPVGLHYVQSRLEALQELESLLAGAPVDYFRAYVSDLGDHRALEQLRRILGLLGSLKVVSVLEKPARDPTPVSLVGFGRLRSLELRGCDLSSSAAKGLLELRGRLEKLICHDSTDALRHVFASRIVDIKDSPVWSRLSFISCACNGLILMDESLQLLPVVETLDLSRNQFAKVANLRKCTKLQHLDLGFNHLRSISSLSEVSSRIVKLVLRNNALTTLRGIENLKTVEGLDLSYNIISNFSELEILASLPCLQSLWLEGNPICCARWYRSHVFSFFSHPEKLDLDDNGISTREYWERHIILASRQKQPSGYGFYFPAKDEPDEDSCLNSRRKKYYRLASIEDEEQKKYFSPETIEQESASCDSDDQRNDENAVSGNESEIVTLMNKVEYMKKEQSILWLREFKEWMDQTPGHTTDKSQCTRFNIDPGKEKCAKQRKGERLIGESSSYVTDIPQASEGGSRSKILESNLSFTTCASGHSSEYCDANERVTSEHSKANINHISATVSRNVEENSDPYQLEVQSRKSQDLSSLEVKAYPQSGSLTVEGGDQEELKFSSEPLTAIDEIMGSRTSSIYPGSPPHYEEDILQRRLFLEEEFLQLSAESQSIASSDSDTSCSDDDSCVFSASITELDHFLIRDSIEQDISDTSDTLSLKGNVYRHEESCFRNNTTSLSTNSFEPNSSKGKILLPGHMIPSSRCDNSDGISSCSADQYSSQYVSGMDKRTSKRKPKKRTISLSGNFVASDNGTTFEKDNGILEVGVEDCKEKQGQLSCNGNYVNESCEDNATILTQINAMEKLPSDSSLLNTKTGSRNPDQDAFIKDFFHAKIADSRTSESCQEVVRCECLYQLESDFQKSEVALLRSSKNNLHLLSIDAVAGGQETISKVLGCHRLEELREVVLGLGLQALRIYMEGNDTYLFLPRTIEKCKDLLCVLSLDDSAEFTGCSLQSWEQVQVKLLENCLFRSLKMGVLFYSLLLFWHDKCEGESWVPRSLFVIEGCMLVCIENLVQFGCLADDSGSTPPYYSVDSCCPIQNILEMVIELDDSRCLTLTLNNLTSGNACSTDKIATENPGKECMQFSSWKLQWFSEERLLKFVAVLKAIYLGLTSSPLPVKCISF